MKRPHLILAAALSALFSASFISQAVADNQRVRVRGTVSELKGQTLSVTTREGGSVVVALGDIGFGTVSVALSGAAPHSALRKSFHF